MIARVALAAACVAACGDGDEPAAAFEVVGHNDLFARGMNSAIAIADDVAYVGSRVDGKPVLIVDLTDQARPEVVGELGLPHEGLVGMSARELRAVPELDLLVVLNLRCSPDLHGCAAGGEETENLKIYDIAERASPQLVGTYEITKQGFASRSPHEFFLWRDPADPARVLVLLAAPPGKPAFEILDISTGVPSQVFAWDPFTHGGLPIGPAENILHSVAASNDGRHAYMSHQTGGLFVTDLSAIVDRAATPAITMVTPPTATLTFGVMGPHSAVPVPGRELLVVTEEVYPAPFGAGCPWGHVRVVDIADPAAPAIAGEYKLPENDCAADAPRTAFTAHNATATRDIALVTWYAGGLQAIDISDATRPTRLAEFRPEPLASVAVEDPGLGGNPVSMWSYPIIKDGLVYAIDSRNGLYVLRYTGPYSEQITERAFLEGNSNLGAL